MPICTAKDFADIPKTLGLEIGSLCWIFRGASGVARVSNSERGGWKGESIREMQWEKDWEEAASWECWQPLEAGKGKETDYFLGSPEGPALPTP